MKKHLAVIAGALCALAIAFASGRYSAPTTTVTVEKEVEKVVEKKVEVKGEDIIKVVYRTRTIRPDGTKEEREEERTETKRREETTTDTKRNREVETRIVVERNHPRLRMGALVGTPLRLDLQTSLLVGGHVEKPNVLGPFSLGAMVLYRPSAGEISVLGGISLEF